MGSNSSTNHIVNQAKLRGNFEPLQNKQHFLEGRTSSPIVGTEEMMSRGGKSSVSDLNCNEKDRGIIAGTKGCGGGWGSKSPKRKRGK